jgi:hypothetical protein
MSFEATIVRLRELNEKRKHNQLTADERTAYEALRDDFARAFVRANRITLRPGQTSRQVLRVACAIQLELSLAARVHKTITLDISTQGLAALIGESVAVGAPCDFVLRTKPDPIRGLGRVVGCARYGSGSSSFRVSLAIDVLSQAQAERLELIVLDTALAALAT